MLPSWSFVLLSVLHLTQAIDVYLHPQADAQAYHLSPEGASFALAKHLDLEMFEPLAQQGEYYEEYPLFGKGVGNALVITLESPDAIAVVPEELEVTYTLGSHPDLDSLSSVLYTLLSRARRTYDSVYESSGPSWRMSQLDALSSFLDSEEPSFAAIELRELSKLRLEYGSTNEEYQNRVRQLQDFLRRVITGRPNLRLAIVTFDAFHSQTRNFARQEQSPLPPNRPPPQQPIGSISTCYVDQPACQNATDSCSGRGECVQATKSGRTCFVCLCGVTQTGEGASTKTEKWAGDSCERKDISAPFVLLTGTVLVLIILVVSSVSLLSGIGEGELPSTLLSTAILPQKD
ncbi:hypothetical protein M378DRAFT_161516 [Amanita muscaria Koide BX008]|uniref:Vacuolar sorting protein Vps3844 C-terminal domain-containing protein n=1 Tax=Amanita muscaria (strain Koide BX008) TaxID=946122 RepID=A0A0C2SRE6_AMAMK|nr:hypothetical protein M378DRAFT_161516 [Amanita muscaria Koide BX008]